ncbi:lactonase family protein [Schlesneria paludicola]|uniref:lactonase family protein n=1 Tax=Schlesneria paludicola TaxID=360056 RepID=UPI00029A6B82|nr:lactonase family protein [Schlesneria paludicola]
MTWNRVCFSFFLVMGAMLTESASTTRADDPVLFITSFAAGEQGGIQAYQFNVMTGALTPKHRTSGVEHPFFIALSPDKRFLYSIHAKSFGGKDSEEVAAYALDGRSGQMTLLNRQSSRGTASCYLDVDSTGNTVLVANYSTGNIASFPVKKDGALGESVSFFQHVGSSVDPARQTGANAHCIVVSPDNRFALVADLGIDQILTYRLDAATSKLSPSEPPFIKSPAGAGPRHLTFHPNGRYVYVINELKNSVTLYDYATASGQLTERQTISTLPPDFTGVTHTADVKITPDGRYLYGTNRGHDSIAAYRIADDGTLTLIEIVPSRGQGPQNLLIAGHGAWLICANMPGNNVAVFQIDAKTGKLSATGEPVSQISPSCIRLLP